MKRIVLVLCLTAVAGCASVGEHVLQAGTQGDIRFAPAGLRHSQGSAGERE